ncbi:uncharacterized protein LOC143375553 isoform X1 [Andrena cerasifolii]|uniref:uncharacterized protein LOC143375553 isoform X1 n=1 Tax=Andrena cerasifolii TaxID=2819439 RepID=UPI0040378972
MTNARDPFGEDVSLLYPDSRGERFNRLSEGYCETPIVKGVVSQLRRWPADLFYAFVAACFIIGSLVFLIFVTVAVCLPTVAGNRLGEISILEIETSPNVYFFKLGNRQWSTREFCYIETAAHKHPDLNVYLINLLKEEPLGKRSNEVSRNETKLETRLNDSLSTSHLSPGLTPEERLRERLVLANGNIRIINVSVEKFFKGSKLSMGARALDDESLEMAAKTHLLWSIPGIALKPSMYCALDSVKRFLCNRNKTECLPDKLATIEPENGIQATGVPCQAFVGFLLQEISKGHLRGKYTLKDAVDKYCPRAHYCPEIRILDATAKCPTEAIDCPIVYSTTISQVDPNPGDFVT